MNQTRDAIVIQNLLAGLLGGLHSIPNLVHHLVTLLLRKNENTHLMRLAIRFHEICIALM